MFELYGAPKLISITSGAIKQTVGGILNEFIFDAITGELDYGIYSRKDGKKIAVDVVLSMDHDATSVTPTYPIRAGSFSTGSFSTYNKVAVPRTFDVTVSKEVTSIWSGLLGEMSQQEFMAWLDTEVRDATLFDIHMPEFTAENYTMTEYRISRSANDGTSTRIIARLRFSQVGFYETAAAASEASGTDTESSIVRIKKSIEKAKSGAMDKVNGSIGKAKTTISASINNALGGIADFVEGS